MDNVPLNKGRGKSRARLWASASLLLILLPLQGVGAQAGPAWSGPENNYPLNWNYSPQTAINESNAANLAVQWTFPVPSAPPAYTGAEGAMVTPLVVSGILYTVTNWHRVFAINAGTGRVIWFRDLPIDANYSRYIQPSVPGPLGLPLGHYHSLLYTTAIQGQPLIWVLTNSYQVYAIKALTGDIALEFNPIAQMQQMGIQGNFGMYDVDTPSMSLDQQRGILIFGPSSSEGSSAGRGFLAAWNVDASSPEFLWRTFIMPPQDGSDTSWSLKSVERASHAYIFNGTAAVDLKALSPGALNSTLFGDWGTMGFNGTRSFAGASAGWGGSWAIDQSTGVAFVGTNTPTPDWNATYRPGPDLWSNSVLAVNETDGSLIWGFQTQAHGLGDYDCSWNVLLANATVDGTLQKVVYKGCKDGFIFALGAQSGRLLWALRPDSIRTINAAVLNPLDRQQMTKVNWPGYPSKGPVVQNPPDTGSLESDIAYDPGSNTIFAAPYNQPKLMTLTDVPPNGAHVNSTQWQFAWGVDIFKIRPVGLVNTTITAVDASTGRIKWTYFIPDQPYRGGLTVSGGVLYVSTLDGTLRMLNAANGTLIAAKTIGGSLLTQPSLAADAGGRMELFLTDMGSSRWGPVFPGFIQALAPVPAGKPPGISIEEAAIFVVAGAVAGILVAATAFLLMRERG